MSAHTRGKQFFGWFVFAVILALAAPAAYADTAFMLDAVPDNTARNLLSSNVSGSKIDIAAFLGADRFYNDGITGQQTISANVEGGHIWNHHESLTQVTELYTGPYGASGIYYFHPTAVGMMLGGRGDNVSGSTPPTYPTGMAPGTDLRSGAFANQIYADGSFSFYMSDMVNVYNHFFGTADVINSSIGSTDPAGNSDFTKNIDGMAYQNPATTMVCAAGNEGPSTNTVGSPASGYNSISVGAMGNANSYNTIASFSSRGPLDFYNKDTGVTTHGVRAGVDICAPGTNIVGAVYDSSNTGNTTSYAPGNGTSFASPIVAGGVALLKSASRVKGLAATSRDTRVVKAVLLNSATKPTGWNNGQSMQGGVLKTTQSLDWTYGAGVMNLDKGYDQLLSGTKDVAGLGGGQIQEIGWDYGSVATVGLYNDYHFDASLLGNTNLTATLSWFCNRSIGGSDFSVGQDNALADLDLQVWNATTNTKIADSASNYNNVEHLYFTLAGTDDYFLRVLYDAQTYGTISSVAYGLAWSATTAPVPEPSQIVMLLGLVGMFFARRRLRRG